MNPVRPDDIKKCAVNKVLRSNGVKIKTFLILIIFISITAPGFAKSRQEKLFEKADKFYLQGNYEGAVGRCKELLQKFKTTNFKDDANFLAGLSLLKLGQYPDARKYFNKVLRQKPASSLKEDAYLGLADSYFLEENFNEAAKLYEEFSVSFPNGALSDMANSRLEDIAKKQGRPAEEASWHTVQIGIFKKKSNARRLYRKFKKKGYSAYMISYKEKGKTFYKVRIGKFKSKEQAKAFAKKLKKQGYDTKVSEW